MRAPLGIAVDQRTGSVLIQIKLNVEDSPEVYNQVVFLRLPAMSSG